MPSFYVNTSAQSCGAHEVHRAGCAWIPRRRARMYLGEFVAPAPAIGEARHYYRHAQGCAYCTDPALR
ncbi:MAG: hypothetical protein ACU0BF_03670 [Paracoccaceae bacterium]